MLRLIGSLSLVCLLMATSTMAQTWSPVLDAEGQPLISGVDYYILPAATDTAGGLTLINRINATVCPFYIGQEPLTPVVSQGLPFFFTPRVAVDDNIIRETRDFTISFSGATACAQSVAWRVGEEDPETGRRFIVTGGEPGYFNIVKNELGLYTFEWCPNCLSASGICPKPRCGSAGIVVENGQRLLVLDGPAFPFVFRKVY